MATSHHEHQPTARRVSRAGRPLKLALLLLVLIGGFYLLREHWSHVAGNWIYLLLLTCPLMHLFHGHGGHGGHGDDRSAPGSRGGKGV